jgi:hypothetical protein
MGRVRTRAGVAAKDKDRREGIWNSIWEGLNRPFVIRKIRNAFAHNAALNTFDKSPVRDFAMDLTIPNWYKLDGKGKPSDNTEPKIIRVPSDKDIAKLSTPRGRFHVSCKCFFTALALIEPRTPVNPQF